jgi:hypothetical protein
MFYPNCTRNHIITYTYSTFSLLVLHPKLTELVMRNAKTEDEAKKTEVAVVLLEAYASLTCCCILYITSAVPNIFINQALYLNCLLHSILVLLVYDLTMFNSTQPFSNQITSTSSSVMYHWYQ